MVAVFASLSFLSALIAVAIGFFVFSRNPRSYLTILYLMLCITVSSWAFVESEVRQSVTGEQAATWQHLSLLWLFTPALILNFCLVLTGVGLARKWYMLVPLYATSAVLLVLRLTPLTSIDVQKEYWGWTYSAPNSVLDYIGVIWAATPPILALLVCYGGFRKEADAVKRSQLKFVMLGISIPIALGLLTEALLPLIGIRVPEMTTTGFAIGTSLFIGYAIWQYQLFELTPERAAEKIVSTMSDSLLIVDGEGRITSANEASLKMLGYGEEELLGQSVTQVFCRGSAGEPVCRAIVNDASVENINGVEATYEGKNGLEVPVSLSCSKIKGKRGGTEGIICIARAEAERRRAAAKIKEQNRELSLRNQELAVLYDFSKAVSEAKDMDGLLEGTLKAMTGLTSLFRALPKAGIFLIDDNGMRHAGDIGGARPGFLKVHEGMKLGDCLCGQAALQNEIIYSRNSTDDLRHKIHEPDMAPHGHIIVPLNAVGKTVGVMYLYLPPGSPDIDERQKILLTSIGARVGTAIEQVRLYEQTQESALHDPLTGLGNRRLMSMELEKDFARMKRSGQPISLIMLDLDHFKDFNDRYGHVSGDSLLEDIGRFVNHEIREVDLAVRYGGEEFLIILPDTRLPEAKEVAERIREKVASEDFFVEERGQYARMTVSLGIACLKEPPPSHSAGISMADAALYEAKRTGRNRVEAWRPELSGLSPHM